MTQNFDLAVTVAAAIASAFSLLASYLAGRAVAAGRRRPLSLTEHADEVARQLGSEPFSSDLRRLAVLETTVAALVEAEMEWIADLSDEQFLTELARAGFVTTDERIREAVRRFFSREGAKKAGAKLVEKLVGLLNKAAGLG